MSVSSYEVIDQYKSRLRVSAGFLHRSRETQKRAATKLRGMNKQLKARLGHRATLVRQLEKRHELLEEELAEMQRRLTVMESSSPPEIDFHVKGLSFGCKMISLCIAVAKRVGQRASVDVIALVAESFGLDVKIPEWTSVRGWLQRFGLAQMKEPIERADDWIWIVDHSNQIGQEKVLVILAIRASKLPPPGKTIQYEDVRLLLVQPGTSWNRDDMRKAYKDLAETHGAPRAVLCDGAVELRESVDILQEIRPDTIALGDFKHKAANVFKSVVGNSKRFKQFSTLLGQTRGLVQQTELSSLSPLSFKSKSRFMNIAAVLRWARMVLSVIDHGTAKGRQGITKKRLLKKFGWLRGFRIELERWASCQEVICFGVKFINSQGLYAGLSKQLEEHYRKISPDKESREIADRLISFVAENESKLKEGERLIMSTEILESAFGQYKQMEGQHSRGGFTSLLAAFGIIFVKPTIEAVRRSFERVKVKDVKNWLCNNLGETVTSQRRIFYNQYGTKGLSATKLKTA